MSNVEAEASVGQLLKQGAHLSNGPSRLPLVHVFNKQVVSKAMPFGWMKDDVRMDDYGEATFRECAKSLYDPTFRVRIKTARGVS
jgi:hypothetical protein